MKIESTHLLTLSEFVLQQKEEGHVSARTAQEIIHYNDFLKQDYTFELANELFPFFSKTDIAICDTLSDLAEMTSSSPIKFAGPIYFYNEELY